LSTITEPVNEAGQLFADLNQLRLPRIRSTSLPPSFNHRPRSLETYLAPTIGFDCCSLDADLAWASAGV
jgi:hypothetical protein